MTKRTEAVHRIDIKKKGSTFGFTRYKRYSGPIANKREALYIAREYRNKTGGRGARVISVYDKKGAYAKFEKSPNYYVYVS